MENIKVNVTSEKRWRFSISEYLTAKLTIPRCCHNGYEYQKAFIFDIPLTFVDYLGFFLFSFSFFLFVCLNQKKKITQYFPDRKNMQRI